MLPNSKQGFIEVEVDGEMFLFRANFAFVATLHEVSGVDPAQIYEDFLKGNMNPEHIRDCMLCGMVYREGKEILPSEKKSVCEELITLKGLQECWSLCQYLLSYAMLGSIKKARVERNERVEERLNLVDPFRSTSLKNLLLVWGWMLLISGICACLSTSLFKWLFA